MRPEPRDDGASAGPRASSVGLPGSSSEAAQQRPQQRRRRRTADRGGGGGGGGMAPGTAAGLFDAVADGLRDRAGPWHPVAEWAEKRAGVDRRKLLAVAVFAVAAYLLNGGPGSTLLGDAVAFLYPAYATAVSAVTRRHPDDDDDDDGGGGGVEGGRTAPDRGRRWLTYWTTLVTVLAAERLLGPFALPGYALIRCAFFAWCFAPGGGRVVNGADFVYATVVRRLRPF